MKTLSDILHQHLGHNLYFDLSDTQLNCIYNAMMEAIQEDRKRVLENAKSFNAVGIEETGLLIKSQVIRKSITDAPLPKYM